MAVHRFDADPATLGRTFFGANLLAGLSALAAVAIARSGTDPRASTGGGPTGGALHGSTQHLVWSYSVFWRVTIAKTPVENG